jgi:hypothetical protein
MNYADYGFYTTEYHGSLSYDTFSSLIVKASREIDKNVNVKLTIDFIQTLDEMDQYKIKYTACELCDYFNQYGSNSSYGKANTISIDGVSINRLNKTSEDIKNIKNNIIDNLPQEIIRFI